MDDPTTRGQSLEEAPPERDLPGALHEVSNALTVMLGWIERASASIAEESSAARALAIVAAQAQSARAIARRAVGAEVPEDEPKPAGSLLAEAVLSLAPEAARARITLRQAVDPALAGALVQHGSSLLQVMTNLLLNSIAFSPPGALVQVDGRCEEDGQLVIGVSDEGPGVPPALRAELFTAGASSRVGGAGIGLRHAAALARCAGGALSLGSAECGARFEVRWPHEPLRARPRTPSERVPAGSLAGARVLVVEDDDAVVDLLDTALTARGASVVSVKQRSELGLALTTGVFDAALLDLSPIQDDAAGAMLAVRAASPGARLIVISGSGKELPALPEGVSASWVRKPFEIAEIVRAIAER